MSKARPAARSLQLAVERQRGQRAGRELALDRGPRRTGGGAARRDGSSRSTSTCEAGLWPTSITEPTSSGTCGAGSMTSSVDAAYRLGSITCSPRRSTPSSVSRVRRALEHSTSSGAIPAAACARRSPRTRAGPGAPAAARDRRAPGCPSSISRGEGRTIAWSPASRSRFCRSRRRRRCARQTNTRSCRPRGALVRINMSSIFRGSPRPSVAP